MSTGVALGKELGKKLLPTTFKRTDLQFLKEYLTNWLRTDTNHINNQHIYMNAATAKIA